MPISASTLTPTKTAPAVVAALILASTVTMTAWAAKSDRRAQARATAPLPIARPTPFSAGPAGATEPGGWAVQATRNAERKTRYDLIAEGGTIVLRARADGAAATLRHSVYAEPARTPILRWRWRTERMLQSADMTTKQGDDHVAKLCVFFDRDPEKLPLKERALYKLDRARLAKERAKQPNYGQASADQINSSHHFPAATLCYVWDNRQPVETMLDNPHSAFIAMVVVNRGQGEVGRWVSLRRNILDDYKRAFRSEAPQITGVSVSADTDDTGESATTYFGDIEFVGR